VFVFPSVYGKTTSECGLYYYVVQDVVKQDDPSTFSFHIALWWEGKMDFCEDDEAIAKVKAVTADIPIISEPFRSAIQSIPRGSNLFVSQLRYWATVPWDNRGGRVALAGDAAHSMIPSKSSSWKQWADSC
jgi:hypothetical protein